MPSYYQDTSGRTHTDFAYSQTGTYHRPVPPPHPFRRKAKPQARRGRVCPGCGMTRSMTNMCECNS